VTKRVPGAATSGEPGEGAPPLCRPRAVQPVALVTALFLAGLVVLAAGCSSRKVDHSIPSLVQTLKDKDPNMRYWAAESLGHFGAEARTAVPDLVGALADEDKMVRMGAGYALAEIGPAAADAVPALKEALKDPAKEVRAAAAYALKRIQAKKK
jgi:HEAT repeat protein